MEFKLNQLYFIDDDRLVDICKYRQGSECCKYIVYFEKPGRFCCVKKVNDLKLKIDSQAADMKATGDNCEGLPNETDQIDQGT